MRCSIYIDGFNLYYLGVKDTPYKWLDVRAMCANILPAECVIDRLHYFTARVKSRPSDPGKAARQDFYLQALRTLPGMHIVEGKFLEHNVLMKLAPPAPGFATVIKTEEKGSDVNLATQLLVDGFQDLYDVAAVVTNDSDLTSPIRAVRDILKRRVVVLSPNWRPQGHVPHINRSLQHAATDVFRIREGVLRVSQFSDPVMDGTREIRKPAGW